MSAFTAYEQFTEYGAANPGGIILAVNDSEEAIAAYCRRYGLALVAREVTRSVWKPVEA
ncbi:hypothetical protein [Nonomuraea roseola]|uniref:Uncharacterized protein n=1 Tax=Nonomuraea roseola TaxID=46179 RepID=A0ABV5Q252_9ACTN